MQIDLQDPLKITKATQNGKNLKVKKVGNAHFIALIDNQITKTNIYYYLIFFQFL